MAGMTERKPIEGIRILDLSRVWAGPLATRMLADVGAEVILIEAPTGRAGGKEALERMKQMRQAGRHFPYYPDGDPGDQPWNRMGMYNDFSRNKLGMTLDLRYPEGQDIFKRLVAISDVVVENYTPRVMANFGLGYEALREVNPAIIMISMPGYGNTGPYRDYPAFGTSVEQHAGFSSLIGYADSGPYRTQSTYCDPLVAVNAAGAVMLALWHRRCTGKGQYIELAHIEASVCLLGEPVMDHGMNGRRPQRLGNRHPHMAPHGAYRCRGDDAWLSIAVATDEEWQAMVLALGNPAWAAEERFAGQLGRWHNQDELDKLISGWTALQDHHEAMRLLQRHGVTAAAVLNARELMEDPHLRERGYFVTAAHPQAGTHDYPGLPLRFSGKQLSTDRPSPCIGQHSRQVLRELLGMSEEEIESLVEADVTGDGPVLS
jgi:crotonobetainyl-CoA:carnitine CoA-transferase CaiB-like acyl-CoA transferase